ncbi:MAG: ROK family protein [Anaerolineae bacterium]|nr:ROK family protein [Anaerolineae bacterium]NIO00472.1 ROK family protein [Anaerolineae bacterium]NIQ83221.1 ROK family protein [Anaerolineae bacterium]
MVAPGRATKNLYLGIDLGGTKIITAIVDGRGRIVARDYRETEAQDGPTAVLGQMTEAASSVIAESGVNSAGITGVGIAAPGPIDAHSGVVTAPPNLPGWKDVPLKQLIKDRLGLPTALENDANAAALAEHRFGAGRGTKHMIYVTASTGIGGGFILDGRLYAGATGSAAEIGHMTILPNGPFCGCGNRGCLEALASGRAIAGEARELVHGGARTRIADLAHGDPDRISAKLVAQAAAEGDAEAGRILDQAMSYLGIGMANLVNLFNPELLVIGGGLTKMGERLFGPVRSIIDQRAFPANAHAVRVIPAELGDDVGVLGAAAVAMLSQH